MKITLLGVDSAIPSKDSGNSCFLLEENKQVILFDCGSGAVAKLHELGKIHEVEAIVISHAHYDHVVDLMTYYYAIKLGQRDGLREKKPVKVYIPRKRFGEVETEWFYVWVAEVQGKGVYDFYYIADEERIKITQDIEIESSVTQHSIHGLMYKIRNEIGVQVGYTGDTGLNEKVKEFLKGCNVIVSELSLLEKWGINNPNHMTTKDFIELGETTKSSLMIGTHMWYDQPKTEYEAEVKKYADGRGVKYLIGKAGQEIQIN